MDHLETRLFAHPTNGRPYRYIVLPLMLLLFALSLHRIWPVAADPLFSRPITQEAGLEGRLIWIDSYANIDTLSSRQGIAALMEKIRRAHINTVVFGAKMFGGQALYASAIAPRLTAWKDVRVTPNLDILRAVVEEAHARGLKVHAAIDVFSDGHRYTHSGPAYEHPEWQTTLYTVRRELVTPEGQRLPIYAVNTDVDGEVVSAFTPGYGWRKPHAANPDNTQVVAILAGPAQEMRVVCVTDCRLLRDNQRPVMPRDGLLLYGRGAMAEWMLRNLHTGDQVGFTAVDKFVPIGDDELEGSSIFLNPVLPAVRQRALSIISEIVRQYDVDGVTFDRMRFSGVNADFSDFSRAQFEAAIGKRVAHWPDDILKLDPIPGREIVRGPLFNAWVEWRAGQITSFLRQATAQVHAIKPSVRIGVYVGSWYDKYYAEGVNWASPDYTGGYDWMTATYGQTGYAREVDYLTTGCYYPNTTAEDALREDSPAMRTVEVAADRSTRIVSDAAFVYAGIFLVQYKNDGAALRAAIDMARRNSQGVMLFDAVYVNQYNTWNVLEKAFATPATAPHDVPGLLGAVRQVRSTVRAAETGNSH